APVSTGTTRCSRVPSRSTSCPARRTVQSSPELASSRSRRRRSCSPPWWRRSWTGASSERRAFGAADGPARSRLEAAIRRGTPAARIARAVAIAASVTRIVGSEPSRGDNPSTTASVPLIAGTSSCWTAGRARTTLSVGESLGSCSGCTAVACTSSPLTKASRTTASPRGSSAPITVMLLLVMTRTYRRARPSRVFAPAHYRVSHSAGDRVRPPPAERSPRTTSQVIRSLAPSVYLPSLLEFTGQAALMPVIPLLALQLGFSVPQAAALTTIFGIASFLGPIPAGRLISRVGARPALVTTGSLLVVANLVAFTVISHGLEAGAGL